MRWSVLECARVRLSWAQFGHNPSVSLRNCLTVTPPSSKSQGPVSGGPGRTSSVLRRGLDYDFFVLLDLVDLWSNHAQELQVELGLLSRTKDCLLGRGGGRPKQFASGIECLPGNLDLAESDITQVLYRPLDMQVAERADVHPRIHARMKADAFDLHLDSILHVCGHRGAQPAEDRDRGDESRNSSLHDGTPPAVLAAATL